MRKSIYVLLATIFIFSLLGLGQSGLTESSEARYGEISREMVVNNDFIHPKLLEIQHFHKPPLTYYITALGYKLFGINEFGERFFLQVALIFQLFLVYKIGLLLFRNERIAIGASIIYFSFPILLISTNNLTTDAYLTTLILASIYFWIFYKLREKYSGLYLSNFLLGLGFLTKGPVVFLPFLIFVISYNYFQRQNFKITIHHILSLLLLILISSSWFAIIINENAELWNYFFKTQTFERILNAGDFHRDKPFWYFFATAPLLGLPWFLFFLIYIFKKRNQALNESPIIQLLLVNIGIILLSFSLFSSKIILYILPLYSYVALTSAYFLDKAQEKILRVFIRSYRILLILLSLGVIVLVATNKIILTTISAYLLFTILTLSIGLFYYRLFESQKKQLLSLSLVFSMVLIFSFRIVGAENPYLINSPKALAQEIKKIQKESGKNKIAVFDTRLSALPFYLDQKIINIYQNKFEAKREVFFEKNHDYQNYYWDINNQEDMSRLIDFLKNKEGILVAKRTEIFEDPLEFYLKDMKVLNVDKWILRY